MKIYPRWVVALGLASFGCAGASAQDVTVGELQWHSGEAAPEVLPKVGSRLRPSYPADMKKTPELGYVVVWRRLDEKGKIISSAAGGTHVPFQRAVEEEMHEWKIAPGVRDGKPVESSIWVAVMFNPKSAAVEGPDATPRLLAVEPVYQPIKPTQNSQVLTVPMKLAIAADGAITDSKPEREIAPALLAAIRESLAKWRFAPARQNGQPVAAELTVPVFCEFKPRPAGEDVKLPRVTYQEPPVYPIAMRRYGLTGKVMLDFVVSAEGRVQNVVVHESDNPAFDEPAITAVRAWKFQPGTRNGKPAAVSMRVPILFQLDSMMGDTAFRIDVRADQSKLPPEMRYDKVPVIRGVLVPVYPYELRRDGVKGKARAAMMIHPQGLISDVKVLSADRPEFGRALAAALEGFRFDPALNKGKPVPFVVTMEQNFNFNELPDNETERMITLEKKSPDQIYSASALDVPLKPLSRRPPVFPVTAPPEMKTGEALIECLIDKEGRVRAPRIASATHEAFGYAAVQAVAGWWFEPGLVKGKPVVVRVRIPFNFGPTKTGKAPAAEGAGEAKK